MKTQSFKTALKAPSNLFVRDDSRTISKVKPEIRIIHIVAPEVIKTDVENFRELVQNLTGNKPAQREMMKSRDCNKENNGSWSQVMLPSKSKACSCKLRNNMESAVVPMLQDQTQRIKEETIEEVYPNGFLSNFLGDLDGFFQDMNEFPLFSLRSSSQISTFGEASLC